MTIRELTAFRPPRRVRMIALDVDGTLLDPHEQISPRVRKAIRDAIADGCLVTLATGRRLVGAQFIAQELGLDLPLILHGGAVVQDSATGAVIYQHPHEPETVEALVDLFLRHGRQPIVYESPGFGGRLYVGDAALDSEATRQYEALRGPFVRVPRDELRRIRHVLSVATLSEPGTLGELRDAAAAIADTSPLLSPWHLLECDALEVFPAGCSKARALEHVAAAHGITMDEIMAIGDGLNDCEILGAVGLGVAMGNACPEALAVSRVQVGRNDEDGVAEAIERFVLRH